MKSLLRNLALAAALSAAVGCGGGGGQKPAADGGAGGGGAGGTSGPDGGAGGAGGLTLIGWVDDLVTAHTDETSASDTVEDKVGVIVDTADPAAFDPLLQAHTP